MISTGPNIAYDYLKRQIYNINTLLINKFIQSKPFLIHFYFNIYHSNHSINHNLV